METITEKEVEFLLFVNASEKSYLQEITSDFERWDCDKSIVVEKLRYLIRQELVQHTINFVRIVVILYNGCVKHSNISRFKAEYDAFRTLLKGSIIRYL